MSKNYDIKEGPSQNIAARLLSFVNVGLNAVGTVWIFVLMVVVNADVFGRYLFNAPVPGTAELVGLSIVGIVFLQLSHTVAGGRLTRADVFLNWLDGRRPRAAAALHAFHYLAGLAVFLIVLKSAWGIFTKAWVDDVFVGHAAVLKIYTWPFSLIVFVCSVVIACQYLLMALTAARSALRRPNGNGSQSHG